jgi:hypothetical protein
MAVNEYTDYGVFDIDEYIDNIDASIEALWMRRDEHKGVLGQFFNVDTAASISYKESSVSSVLDLPRENNDTEGLPYATSAPGRDKTYNLVNYRLAVQVTDTMLRADRKSKIMSQMGGLVKSAERKIEYMRAGIYTNAFTSGTGADGTYLVEDSHDQEDPRASAWDNEGTGALTGANLQALRLLQMNMTNERGYPDPVVSMKLLVPTALQQKALELTQSVLTSETSTNTKTVLIGGLEVVVSPYLTGSATAYFLHGDRQGDQMGMKEIYLMRPSLDNTGDETVDVPIKKRIKFIGTVDFYHGRNVAGSLGT